MRREEKEVKILDWKNAVLADVVAEVKVVNRVW